MYRGIHGVLAFALCIGLFQTTAYADASSRNAREVRVQPKLNEIAENSSQDAATAIFLTEAHSDRILDQDDNSERTDVLFRDAEVERTFDILMRRGGKFAIVVGPAGSGKSEVLNELTYRIVKNKYPQTKPYHDRFKNAVVLKSSARNFIPGGMDIRFYLQVVENLRTMLKRNVFLILDEAHFLNDYMVSVLREQANKRNPLPILLEVDQKSYGNSIKGHPSFTSISERIEVPETKAAQTQALVENLATTILEPMYDVKLSPEIYASLVDVAPDYRRDIAEPRRSLTLLEDFMIKMHRESEGRAVEPTRIDLYKFVADQARLPVIPQNEQEFAEYMKGVKDRMKRRLIGQNHMVDGVVDQFIAAMTSRGRQHQVALMLGPTGVGKTLVGELLAEEFYGDKTRFLELDMTQFKSEHALTSLFGASNGFVSSDREKGAMCDFFDGPGKGGGIIVMNEIEEMSSDAFTRFMEMFDKGEFRGGDGKVRYVGRSLFILTSNKNSDKILSYDAIKGMMRAELQRRLSLITQEQMKKAFTEKASYTEESSKSVKPAVLERVDQLYFASPLLRDDAVEVAKIELDRWVKNYHNQGTTRIELDPSVADVITSAFYNESLGARQIRTAVTRFMTNAVHAYKVKHGYDVSQVTVSARLHPALKTVSYVTVTGPDGKTLTIDGPKVPVQNRLLDAEFRQKLIDLEGNLKKEIFGQDEAIKMVVASIKARYLQGGKEEPVAGFLLGVTGSGKSELAKSVARHLFGRKEAVGLFEMGRIQTKYDLSTILSPGKGIIGSDQPGELEAFLIQYPEGGVLLFDEMSNAGGEDISLKRAIAKQFYTMLQEGYYKSPSGKIYDLSNHVILFTGNDGEEHFKGLSSDSLLEETYKELMKEPNFVKNLLLKAGFTPAFIGRLSFSHMMKPTLGAIKTMIAKKLLDEWRDKVQKNQPFDIEYDEAFIKEIGLLMFSPLTGARSIKEFITNVAGQLVGDEALKADWPSLLETGDRIKIKLDLSVIKPARPFFEGDEPDKTEAVLVATSSRGGKETGTGRIEFTKRAFFQEQAHLNIATAVAYHEMGHAITSFTDITGKKLVKITIIPEKIGDEMSAAGYAQYREKHRKKLTGREYLVHNIAGLLGGSEAELLFMGELSTGRSNDVERVGKAVERLVLRAHLIPELDAAHAYLKPDGSIVMPAKLQRIFNDYVAKIIEEARALAVKQIKTEWHIVKAGAEILLKYGNILEKEYEELVKKGNEAKARLTAQERARWDRDWTQATDLLDKMKIDIDAVHQVAVQHCAGLLAQGT